MRSSRRRQNAELGFGWLLMPFLAASLAAQPVRQPSLEDVVTRAGQYAVDYGRALTSVLAEEAYTQRLVWRREHSPLQERRLRSEIAFVRLTDSTEWLAFRNVLTVDDVPVPYSEGRLERVLQGSNRSLLAEVRSIASDSARYNIGPIARDLNVPTTALHFVHPTHRSNSRFEKEGEQSVDGETVWIIRFKERDRGGLITGTDGRRLPAEGRLWILPSDGRVVRSELVVKDFVRGGDSRAAIHVTWRRDVALDLWVPLEMREHYEGPWSAMFSPRQRERYDIEGVATYSNYRRFSVDFRIR